MRKFFYISMLVLTFCLQSLQVKAEDVTLITNGTGVSKDKAIQNALVSAVEQVYGVYVSGNTVIFNDELIRDEVVQIKRGNIKEYRILNETTLPDKKYSATLQVTISPDNLLKFAQSKGAKCELAGSSFAANIKLNKLHLSNAAKAMNVLYNNLELLAPTIYDYKVTAGEPTMFMEDVYIPIAVDCIPNENYKSFCNIYQDTYKAIEGATQQSSATSREINSYINQIQNFDIRIKMLPEIWTLGFILTDNIGTKVAAIYRGEEFKWDEDYKVESTQYYQTCGSMKLNHHLIEVPYLGYRDFALLVGGHKDGGVYIQQFNTTPFCSFRGEIAKSKNKYDYSSKLTEFMDRYSNLAPTIAVFSSAHHVPAQYWSANNHTGFDQHYVAYDNAKSNWLNIDHYNASQPKPLCSFFFLLCYSNNKIEKLTGFEVKPLSKKDS